MTELFAQLAYQSFTQGQTADRQLFSQSRVETQENRPKISVFQPQSLKGWTGNQYGVMDVLEESDRISKLLPFLASPPFFIPNNEDFVELWEEQPTEASFNQLTSAERTLNQESTKIIIDRVSEKASALATEKTNLLIVNSEASNNESTTVNQPRLDATKQIEHNQLLETLAHSSAENNLATNQTIIPTESDLISTTEFNTGNNELVNTELNSKSSIYQKSDDSEISTVSQNFSSNLSTTPQDNLDTPIKSQFNASELIDCPQPLEVEVSSKELETSQLNLSSTNSTLINQNTQISKDYVHPQPANSIDSAVTINSEHFGSTDDYPIATPEISASLNISSFFNESSIPQENSNQNNNQEDPITTKTSADIAQLYQTITNQQERLVIDQVTSMGVDTPLNSAFAPSIPSDKNISVDSSSSVSQESMMVKESSPKLSIIFPITNPSIAEIEHPQENQSNPLVSEVLEPFFSIQSPEVSKIENPIAPEQSLRAVNPLTQNIIDESTASDEKTIQTSIASDQSQLPITTNQEPSLEIVQPHAVVTNDPFHSTVTPSVLKNGNINSSNPVKNEPILAKEFQSNILSEFSASSSKESSVSRESAIEPKLLQENESVILVTSIEHLTSIEPKEKKEIYPLIQQEVTIKDQNVPVSQSSDYESSFPEKPRRSQSHSSQSLINQIFPIKTFAKTIADLIQPLSHLPKDLINTKSEVNSTENTKNIVTKNVDLIPSQQSALDELSISSEGDRQGRSTETRSETEKQITQVSKLKENSQENLGINQIFPFPDTVSSIQSSEVSTIENPITPRQSVIVINPLTPKTIDNSTVVENTVQPRRAEQPLAIASPPSIHPIMPVITTQREVTPSAETSQKIIVTIGHIDVKVSHSHPSSKPNPVPPPSGPRLSLAEYLRRQNHPERGRS